VETPVWARLHAARHLFLTRKVEHTFLGYAEAQLKKIMLHRAWLLDPPQAPPTRAAFGLPESSTLSRDERHRLESAITDRLRGFGVDDLELEPSVRLAITTRLERFLEAAFGVEGEALEDARRAVAEATLGIPRETVDALRAERRYQAAQQRWASYERWRRERNPARATLEAQARAADQVRRALARIEARLEAHAATPNVRYSQAFINHGREAGASIAHPHGQLLGLPFVPGEILEEERAFERFKGGCIVCTTIEAELAEHERVVLANDAAVVVAPFWSGGPYEMLVMPRAHDLHLPDSDDATLAGVGIAIRDALSMLVRTLGDVAFNLAFHTAPPHHTGTYHWHVHLWPKLSTTAGFERGTGVLINVIPPEIAASELRKSTVAV
jgi:diadenosine tetraphosphate (Ap4A) HIT family hydrolase